MPPAAMVVASTQPSRSVSITLPPRNSVGPPPIPFSRDPKARREALAKQLPLQEGRKVAFHPPPNTSKLAEGIPPGKDEEWILAVVTKCINQDKNRSVSSRYRVKLRADEVAQVRSSGSRASRRWQTGTVSLTFVLSNALLMMRQML